MQLGRAMLNRLFHAYFFVSRGLTIGVRAIVQSDETKFLLVRHTYTPGWHFPGGGVEKGETCEQALGRELRQETGLELSAPPKLHGVFYNKIASKRDHVLAYHCDVEGDICQKRFTLEIAEAAYFDFNNLPDDTDPGTMRRILETVHTKKPEKLW